MKNQGLGLLIQGTREWTDYWFRAEITPHIVKEAGIGVHVQGMKRYYALMLCFNKMARLIKVRDSNQKVLATKDFIWDFDQTYTLEIVVKAQQIFAFIDNQEIFVIQDSVSPLASGGVALICNEGSISANAVTVRPAIRSDPPDL